MAIKKSNNPDPTTAGYVLGAISAFISLGSAVPIVMWHDPNTGEGLPPKASIFVVLMIGVLFFAIGAGILRLFGVRVYKQHDNNDSP